MENRHSESPETQPDAFVSPVLEMMSLPEIPGRTCGQHVEVNGASIYFETFGEGSPVVLLHGGAATIESWFAQIPDLASRYQVIVPEARGHGRSPDRHGEINFEIMAEDLAGLLDHLETPQVSVIGWSDGGVTGLQLAIDRPDLVVKVIAFGAHAQPEGMTDAFRQEIEGATPENFPPILAEGYKALSPDGPDHWPVVFSKLRTMWLTLPRFPEEGLRSIQCPVLLLNGEVDIVTREETERMADLIPSAKVVILEGASHYAPVEIPERFNAVVNEFLSE